MMNQIKNETIAKLNREEIGALGLYNHGVMTYKGILKSRRTGMKVKRVNDYQTNFSYDNYVAEFIRIQQTLLEPEYAMRLFDKKKGEYIRFTPLFGVEFFK